MYQIFYSFLCMSRWVPFKKWRAKLLQENWKLKAPVIGNKSPVVFLGHKNLGSYPENAQQ